MPIIQELSNHTKTEIWGNPTVKISVMDHECITAPTDQTVLFQWILDMDFPQLEDETPPPSFYEVLEDKEPDFRCKQCGDAELPQRTIGTQTLTDSKKNQTVPETLNSGTQTDQGTFPTMIEDLRSFREHSFWTNFKTVLLCISLLNGCYLLCCGICRLTTIPCQTFDVQLITQSPQPSTSIQSVVTLVPKFLWGQLGRFARKLHIT